MQYDVNRAHTFLRKATKCSALRIFPGTASWRMSSLSTGFAITRSGGQIGCIEREDQIGWIEREDQIGCIEREDQIGCREREDQG
jgi:hypothetical protein